MICRLWALVVPVFFFFFNDTATTEIYTLSLHDALPICGYPACRNTKPLPEDQAKHQHLAGMKCELCGGEMLVRTSKFGTLLGCSNYPTCKNPKPMSTGMKCPKCKEGDVIERKTKRKRTFYGCSRYPTCDFASWDKPVDRVCDVCSSPYMVLKFSQKRGEYWRCPSCKAEVMKEDEAAVTVAEA